MGPENAGKVQTSADGGRAAAMWISVRLLAGCSRRPVQQRRRHDRRLSNRQVGWCRAMEAAVHKHRQPERDPLRNPQPVKTAEERRDVDLPTGTEDQPGCSVLTSEPIGVCRAADSADRQVSHIRSQLLFAPWAWAYSAFHPQMVGTVNRVLARFGWGEGGVRSLLLGRRYHCVIPYGW